MSSTPSDSFRMADESIVCGLSVAPAYNDLSCRPEPFSASDVHTGNWFLPFCPFNEIDFFPRCCHDMLPRAVTGAFLTVPCHWLRYDLILSALLLTVCWIQKELKWWRDNRAVNISSPFSNKPHTMYHYSVTNSAPRPESYLTGV